MPAAIVRSAAPLGLERTMLLSLALAASLVACQEPETATGPVPLPRALAVATSSTLTAAADGYVTSQHPNRNGGAKDSMDVARPLRSLVAFDQAAIAAAVGPGTLTHATLRLTIGRTAENWGPASRTIDVHRLTVPWTEAGETYNCAIDSSPNNATKECSGATEWAMASTTAPPWAAPRTAQATIVNNLTGVVELDVTADVVAFLAGTPNRGWILKKTDEEKQGRIVFMTKEGGAAPELVLTVEGEAPDTSKPSIPATGGYDFPRDTSLVIAVPGDTVTLYYRNIFRVRFEDSTSGVTIRNYLQENQGAIIGGLPSPGVYIVRFPDPGSSYAAFDSLQIKLNSTPAVSYAAPAARRSGVSIQSRFPNDGLGATRATWMGTPTPYTRPRLNIRAPLAWGCETGAYGGIAPSVGVVDFFLDPGFPGAGFGVSRVEPDSARLPLISTTVLGAPTAHSHGTGVSGILVGAGDDDLGVAGMIWNARFTFFALTNSGKIPEDIVPYLAYTVFPEASHRGVRILVSSVLLGASNPAIVKELKSAIALYTASGGLFIQAAGNQAKMYSPAALLAVTGSPNLGLVQAVASLIHSDPSVRTGLLLVGGTDNTGKFWNEGSGVGSNYFDGITEILAPATDITTLAAAGDIGPDIGGGFQTQDGTSFSAPFVGGVAALLLAMQPNLTPAQVKQYILDGAQEPRLDPKTGMTIGPEQLRLTPPGATQPVFQLDAYGALTKLSREDPSTPICGLTVLSNTYEDSATHQWQTTVSVEGRPGTIYHGEPATVTVAQGGRRIGLDRGLSSADLNFQDGHWTVGPVGGWRGMRQFLERDTAFVDGSFGMGESVQIRGPSGQGELTYPCNEATAGTFDVNFCRIGVVSSTGDWVHAVVERSNADAGCGPSSGRFASFLVPVRAAAGSPTLLRDVRFEECWPFLPGAWTVPLQDAVAWRADGAVAWVAQSNANTVTTVQTDTSGFPSTYSSVISSMTTLFRQESVVPGVSAASQRTVSGSGTYALGWRVDGRSLISYDYFLESFGVCLRTIRAAEAPEVEVSGPIQSPSSYCGDYHMESMPASVIARGLINALRGSNDKAAPAQPISSLDSRRRLVLKHAVPRVLIAN